MASIHDEVKEKTLAYGKELVDEAVNIYKANHVRTESGEDIIEKVMQLEKEGEWTFRTIAPEEFLEKIKPLISVTYDAYQATDIRSTLPPEVLSDRVLARSLDMLECLDQMKSEFNKETYFSRVMGDAVQAKTPQPGEWVFKSCAMRDFIEWAQQETYSLTNRANEYLRPLCEPMGIKLVDLSAENANHYHVDVIATRAVKTMEGHEAAFKNILERCNEIFQSGMPAETGLGKLRERFDSDLRQKREENRNAFRELLDKEIDLYTIENVVIPATERKCFEKYIMDCETSWYRMQLSQQDNTDEIRYGPLQAGKGESGPCRTEFFESLKVIAQIKRDVAATRAREKDMFPNIDLTITRSDNGKYSISLSREDGVKREAEWKDGNVEFKQTFKSHHKTDTVEIDFGAISQALYREKQNHYKVVCGVTTEMVEHDESTNTKKKTIKTTNIGETERESVSKTGISRRFDGEKKEVRDKLKFNAMRMEAKKLKIIGVKGLEKEKELVKASGEFLGGSITGSSLKQGNIGTPTLNTEAHAINANAQILGLVDMSYNAGAKLNFGAQVSFADLAKDISKVFAEEAKKGNAANLTKILDSVTAILDKAEPTFAGNWSSFSMSIKSIDILSAEVVDLDKKKGNQFDIGDNKAVEYSLSTDAKVLVDAIKRTPEQIEATQKFAFFTAEESSVQPRNQERNVPDAIDLNMHNELALSR